MVWIICQFFCWQEICSTITKLVDNKSVASLYHASAAAKGVGNCKVRQKFSSSGCFDELGKERIILDVWQRKIAQFLWFVSSKLKQRDRESKVVCCLLVSCWRCPESAEWCYQGLSSCSWYFLCILCLEKSRLAR